MKKFTPDNYHWTPNRILSYNKSINCVISAREAGKSTNTWLYSYKQFLKGCKTLVIRRLIADITDTYIEDIGNILNKFGYDVHLVFKRGSIKDGVVDVYIGDNIMSDDKVLFFRVIALSNPLSRIKSLMLPNLSLIIFDEFICNMRIGEKYLTNEVFRFKELFNTFQRESENLRCIFLGNPYSLYNPYFAWLEVPTKKLYAGSFVVGANYVVECYALTEELKAHILEKNPLYAFDDAYTKYAFDGRAINDQSINVVEKLPDNFSLQFVFKIEDKYIGVYRYNYNEANMASEIYSRYGVADYWCSVIKDYTSKRRNVACFDYNQMLDGTYLVSNKDRTIFAGLMNAFRFRKIAYKTIEEAYMMESIYDCL